MFLLKILAFIWQLPQNIIGFFTLVFTDSISHPTDVNEKYNEQAKFPKLAKFIGTRVYLHKCKMDKDGFGVTLGNFIIMGYAMGDCNLTIDECKSFLPLKNDYKHENGHRLQSLILGPLYLIIIGIPSFIHAIFHKGDNYEHFYTEKWANKWGGVED